MTRKNFIARNEGFTCEVCSKEVPAAKGTFRNHCPYCLTSKHVDRSVPGDRAAVCGGLMRAICYEGTDPDKLDLIQICEICDKENRNRLAEDDNKQKVLELGN